MDIGLLAPLSVGIVRWSSPGPWVTAVVNATFSLLGKGEPALAASPRPLTLDRPSAFSRHELEAASDFVPQKEGVDFLVAGAAHTDPPAERISASFALAGCARRFVALASAPSAQIPLSVAYLRTSETHPREPVHVGPIAPHTPSRRALSGGRAFDARGLPLEPLDGSFDFRFFNAAPPEQWLEGLPSGATLTLEGLLPGTPLRRVHLPRLRPLVYLVDARTERLEQRLGLRCDTVLVDTCRAELSLVFRGATDATQALERPLLLVGLESPGTRWDSREIRQHLRRARLDRAIDPLDLPAPVGFYTHDTTRGGGTASAHGVDAEGATLEMPSLSVSSTAPEPTGDAAPPMDDVDDEAADVTAIGSVPAALGNVLPFVAAPERQAEVTVSISIPGLHGAVLPFRERSPAEPVAVKGWERLEETRVQPVRAPAPPPVMPFHESGRVAGPAPPPSWDEVTMTRPLQAAALAGGPVLPFSAGGEQSPAPVAAPGPAPCPESDSPTPPQAAPPAVEPPPRLGPPAPEMDPEPPAPDAGAQAVVAPPRRSPGELLPVSEYAMIKAALQGDPEGSAGVLERHGFDAATWRAQERSQLAALEEEARQGKSGRAAQMVKAMRAKTARKG